MISGQDKAKVESVHYNFGGVNEHLRTLIDVGLQTYVEDRKEDVRKLYRRLTLQLLGGFDETIKKVSGVAFLAKIGSSI